MSRVDDWSVASWSRVRSVAVLASVVLVVQMAGVAEASASRSPSVGRHSSTGRAHHRGRGGLRRTKRATHQASTSEQFTPVSHTVTRGNKTTVQYFGAPTFRHTRGGWVRLGSRVTHRRGAFPLRANGIAAPTWFGRRSGSLLQTRTAGGAVTWSLAGGRNVSPRLHRSHHHNLITYRSIRPGVDLTYELSGGRVKEALLLRSKAAARSFVFKIRDPRHLLGSVKRDQHGTYRFDGALPGGLRLTLPAPTAWSLKKHRQQFAGDGTASMTVHRTHGGYRIALGLNRKWAATQRFPIALDPTLNYTWSGGTLASAFGPMRDDACSGDPCPLSSTDDGSAFSANFASTDTEWYDVVGGLGAMWHADLSSIPATTQIDAASFSLGEGQGTDFYDGDHWDSYPAGWCASAKLRAYDADPQVGDAWSALGDPVSPRIDMIQQDENSASGYPLAQADVTDAVRHWVQGGIGDEATLGITDEFVPTCTRTMTDGNTDPYPAYEDGIWWWDPELSITYSGHQLPPALPVKQAYGCDCRWMHGPDLSQNEGDPVNTALGDSMETTTDVSTPGRGVPLTFRRTYNGADDTDGPLGVGWTFEYNASLSVDSGTSAVTFRDPTGGQSVFTPQLNGSYTGAPGVTGALAADSGGGWTLTSQKGEVLSFNAAGEEIADTDAAGHGETLAYTGTGSARHLHTVTDAAGRAATLAYGTSGDADGRLVSVTTADGREVDYGYDTVDGAVRLSSVIAPDGKQTTISYDPDTGRLNGVTSPGSNTAAQNTFDADGRINGQTDANGNSWMFAWSSSGAGLPVGSGTETTTDGNGNTSSDYYYGNVLLEHTDAYSDHTFYYYDNALNLIAVKDPRGYVTTMTYDAAGNMLTRTAPAPLSYMESWTYDNHGNVTSYTNGRGKTWTYTYNSDNQRLTTTDPLSHTTTMTYTAGGQLATITTPEGRETSYGYDSDGSKTSMTDGDGDQTTWTYDGAGRVTSTTDPRGSASGATAADYTTSYSYDDAGRPLTTASPNGAVTTDSYDNDGNLADQTVTHGSGASLTTLSDVAYTYDANGNTLTTTDFPGTAEERTVGTDTYDAMNHLLTSTDADGGITSYAYDALGQESQMTSPRGNADGGDFWGNTRVYYYDQAGNATGQYDGDFHGWSKSYDAADRVTSMSTSQGVTTNYTYDDAGNQTSATNPLTDTTTAYAYDDANRTTSSTAPGLDPETFTYDEDGNRLTDTTPGGSETSWTYDDAGRQVTQTDPRGHLSGATAADYTTHYGYDPTGNQTSLADQLGHETDWTYDAADNKTSQTDANGYTTDWSYDRLNQLSEVNPPSAGTGSGTGDTTYGYDDYGNLTSLTNGRGKTTTYGYDDLDQLTSVTDPLGREKTYAYDPDGNLTSYVTARGNAAGATAADYTVTQIFDGSGELTTRTTSDPGSSSTSTASYAYDADGHLTEVDDATGATTLSYDYRDGQLTEVDGPGGDYTYGYNTDRRLASRTYPTGQETDYTYNTDGLPDSLAVTPSGSTSETTTLGYNADQQLTSITYPSTASGGPGLSETRSYDRAGQINQVTNQQTGSTTPISQYDYTRDPVGSPILIERTRSTGSGTSVHDDAYTYNDRDWLTKDCVGATSCSSATDYVAYGYDHDGNRTTLNRAGSVNDPGVTGYSYDDADELTSTTVTPSGGSATTSADSYDADGNLTTDGRTWNALNQLTASDVDGVTATYTYDGFGNRVDVTTNDGPSASNVTRQLSWDIDNPLPMLAVITNPDTGSGTTTDTQVYAPDGTLLTSTHPDEAYTTDYYTHDALGSIVDDLRGDGTLLSQTAYDPFGSIDASGTVTSTSDLVETGFGYAGEYTEPTSGDKALRARDYDTSTGRFTSVDPLDASFGRASESTYIYSENTPFLLTDPSGMCPTWICGTISNVSHFIGKTANDEATYVGRCVVPKTTVMGAIHSCANAGTIGAFDAGVEQADGCADHNGIDCAELGATVAVSLVGGGCTAKAVGKLLDKLAERMAGDVATEAVSSLEQGASKVPSTWGKGVVNRKGLGARWADPAAPQANGIRIDAANQGSSLPSQQVDHVVVRSEGRIIGPDGKPIVGPLRENPQAHIPLSDWLRWKSWNTP